MQKRRTKGFQLGLTALLLCALLCTGIVSAAFAADGGGSVYVHFDANGGSGQEHIYTVDENESWNMPDCEFTNPGHVFVGWVPESGGHLYQPGDEAFTDDPWMPDDDNIQMHALWDDMSEEQLAEFYAPEDISLESWNIGSAVDEDTGITYMTAQIGWLQMEDVEDFIVSLNLGAQDGPGILGAMGTSLSTTDGSVSTSWGTSYGTVAVPFLEDGVEQVIANGTVNGVVDGDIVFATVGSVVNGTTVPGNPVMFGCVKPVEYNEEDAAAAWFEDNGYGTVSHADYSTTITLTKDTVLPTDGLAMGNNSYHILMNTHTLTGTMTNGYGTTVYIEHLTSGGKVLAGYAENPQTLTFDGYGYGAQPFGTVTSTLDRNSWSAFAYDGSFMTASVSNGQIDGTNGDTAATWQSWGYANTVDPTTYKPAEFTADELAGHIPQNVTSTLQDNSLVVEWDHDPAAQGNTVRVDAVLSDGTSARLLEASSSLSSSYKDQMIYSLGRRGHISVGEVRCITAEEAYSISEENGQKYVDGIKNGDTLSVTVNAEVGIKGQETDYSSPPVSFTYTSANVGKTFKQGNNITDSRAYLPEVATLTVNSPLEATYTGEPATLDYTLTLKNGTPLEPGVDYTEEYFNNSWVGTATLALTGMGGYAGQIMQPFTIAGIDLNSEEVDAELAYYTTAYDGSSQTPAVVVTCEGKILSEYSDYKVSYKDNKDPGTATVAITPGYNGTFTGTRTETFTIDPRYMNSPALQAALSQNRFAWTEGAGPFTPEVTVKWGDKKLMEGTDYTLEYKNNSKVGTASVLIKGKGNYAETKALEFTIFRPVGLDEAAMIDPVAPEIYTGSELEPAVTVRVGNQILTPGWDYSMAYSNNVNTGEGTVTVTGRRDYTGQTTAAFVIDPADLGTLAAQGALTMTLEKTEYPYGDAIYTFSGGENKPGATLTMINSNGSATRLYEGTSYTLSFENNIEAGTARAIATGKGNYGGMCTAEYTINPLNLNDLYSATVSGATYNGQAQTPAISMYTSYLDENRYTQYYYPTEGADYTVAGWANNTNAGRATVTVTGAGNNFTGTREIDFTINPMPLSNRDFDLSAIATKVGEDGAELHNLTLIWKQNGRNLVEGTDFTVENLYSSGSYAYFYLKGMGNFGSQAGTYDLPITETIGTLPASSDPEVINPSWAINQNGVMTVKGWGTLSKQSAWSNYAGLVKKIVVQNYDASSRFSYISSGTFEDFYNAVECTLPEGVTKIDSEAFPNTANKMVVHLPDTVTTITSDYSGNFSRVRALVNPGSTTEATILNSGSYSYFGYEGYPDFLLWDSHNEERGLMMTGYFGNGGTVTIPNFVDSIESSGFERYGIEKVIIPGTVKSMNAFLQNCYDLRELVIQPGNLLTALPYQFISGCNNVTLYIPDNITAIDTLNYYSSNNMLIVANCDSYAIEWAKGQTSWGSPVWAEETARTYGPRYRLVHKHPTEHAGKAATCTEPGWTAYTTCTACNFNNKVDIPALGHSWGGVIYTWNKDHTEVTAIRICRNDASHKQTEKVAATAAVTTPANCSSEGVRTYTSAAFTNPVFRVQKYTEPIPVGGHAWRAEPSTAAAGGANGVRGSTVCGICGEEQQERTVSAQKVMKIPAMMRTIEAEAFRGTAAEQINVPDKTTCIGDKAFADCEDLLLVVIPATVTTIEGDPFAGSDVAVICPNNSTMAAWCYNHGIPHNP